MPLIHRMAFAAIMLVAVLLALPSQVAAVPACTAAEIIAADPMCPQGTGPCTISRTFEIGDLCVLDFGDRDVTIAAAATLNVASNSVTIKAGSLTIAPRGTILGGGELGPFVCIETNRNFTIQRGGGFRGLINLSAADLGGCLEVTVGGSMIVDGDIISDQSAAGGNGGEIVIVVDGAMTISSQGSISAAAGGVDSTGGNVDIFAAMGLQAVGTITAAGAEGGTVALTTGGNLTSGVIAAQARRGANSGGSVDLEADLALTIAGNINVDASGPEDFSGACGGSVAAEAFFGDLIVAGRLTANGSMPDGSGGCITLASAGDLTVQSAALLAVGTLGVEGCGGTMSLDGGIDLTHAGSIVLSGGFGGGLLDVNTGRLANISGSIDAKGRDAGSVGGSVGISAAPNPAGGVTVSGLVDAAGGRCSFENGCGIGGCIDLIGCVITVPSAGRLFSDAPDGGAITLTARKQMTVAGRINAVTTAPNEGGNGTNAFIFPAGSPPVTTGSTITPAATLQSRAVCTEPGIPQCLLPCPTCGNGLVEFPETCDLGTQPPVNCGGCSDSCRTQVCNDGLFCTVDMCDPRLGCFAVPVTPPCVEPTKTITPTRTATSTSTITPTSTNTPTHTGTPTITGTPTQTGTPTRTATSTSSATLTSTATPTHTMTSTSTVTPTDTVTLTPQSTSTPTETATPAPGRPGDANCDGIVNAADLAAIESAIFEGTTCAGADVNVDGAITAADPAAFVHLAPQ